MIIVNRERLLLACCSADFHKFDDRFAIVEAIAICAEHGLGYPDWVKKEIDAAFLQFYRAVHPDADQRIGRGPGREHRIPEAPVETVRHAERTRARQAFNEMLGLIPRGKSFVVQSRNSHRDRVLAVLVAEKSTFELEPEPHFSGVTKAVKELVHELSVRPPERSERAAGRLFATHYIPPEAWCVGEDIIMKAWSQFHSLLLEGYLEDSLSVEPEK